SGPLNHSGRHTSLADRARALAVILREEFGVPFACYDASGEPLGPPGAPAEPDGPTVLRLAAGRARAGLLPDRRYLLVLALGEPGRPALVAAGALAALVPGGSAAGEEQERLQKWVQAVAERLRLAEQVQVRRRLEEDQAAQVTQVWE